MSEVNYSESVIIPTLQKKVQDLQNSNLVLEVNLLVEQARHRDVAALYSEVKNSLKTSSDQLDVEVNRATSFANEANKLKTEIETISARTTSLENDLRREISVKESILGEYRNLKETYDALMAENNTLKTEIEQLKTPVVDTKKKTKTLIT
jgi:chromosome segregation ATPase